MPGILPSFVFQHARGVTAPALAAALLLSSLACDSAGTTATDLDEGPGIEPALSAGGQAPSRLGAGGSEGGDVAAELAILRRATARFHRLEAATAAGWDVAVTPCLENPPEGAMGVHYGNLGYFTGSSPTGIPG